MPSPWPPSMRTKSLNNSYRNGSHSSNSNKQNKTYPRNSMSTKKTRNG